MSSTRRTIKNLLLASLSSEAFEALEPRLERVTLRLRQPIETPGEPVEHVYFYETALASNVVQGGGEQVEFSIVGRDGMSGLSVLHGAGESIFRSFIQAEGEAFRVDPTAFRLALGESEELRSVLMRYSYAHTCQVASTALSNARFTVIERLARWILMNHDRLEGDAMELTHEFLALMLGVRRAGVTMEMHVLEGEGAVLNRRGRVFVRDRAQLEAFAGEGYGAAEEGYERLTGQRLRRERSQGSSD